MEGDSAHFECKLIPVGDPNMKVEWFLNGRPLVTGKLRVSNISWGRHKFFPAQLLCSSLTDTEPLTAQEHVFIQSMTSASWCWTSTGCSLETLESTCAVPQIVGVRTRPKQLSRSKVSKKSAPVSSYLFFFFAICFSCLFYIFKSLLHILTVIQA